MINVSGAACGCGRYYMMISGIPEITHIQPPCTGREPHSPHGGYDVGGSCRGLAMELSQHPDPDTYHAASVDAQDNPIYFGEVFVMMNVLDSEPACWTDPERGMCNRKDKMDQIIGPTMRTL